MLQTPTQTMSLNQVHVGQSITISAVEGDTTRQRRLMEMGIVPGEVIKVERKAPLGDPVVIQIQGYRLGIRKSEAECILCSEDLSASDVNNAIPIESSTNIALERVALLGNPNCGKTTLFNALTGMKQKVGNYAGVTIEKRMGSFDFNDKHISVVDLPGTYSLNPNSPDEAIAVRAVQGSIEELDSIDGIVLVCDANNLARNLLLFTQLAETGLPMVVALTMTDSAERRGRPVDVQQLQNYLGVPVTPVVARKKLGLETLKSSLQQAKRPLQHPWDEHPTPQYSVNDDDAKQPSEHDEHAHDTVTGDIQARYRWIAGVVQHVVKKGEPKTTLGDRLDQVLVHRVFGLAIFAFLMNAMFYLIYTVADPLMGGAEDLVAGLGELLFSGLNEGPLKSLLLDAVIGGVGGVVVFVPQIAILFLCISLLEESGYLARAAFLLDRMLASVGLHGKSFIPMLSSHACAIPGIMGARSIDNHRDRLATMFVAPFMSCGARLPVYALLIGVFLAPYGPALQSLTLFGCYSLGILVAIATALVLKKTALKAPPSAFLLELPTYQWPDLKQVSRIVWRNSFLFIKKAGTVILGFSILLWASLYYPRMSETQQQTLQQEFITSHTTQSNSDQQEQAMQDFLAAKQVEQSWSGRLGKAMEPAIAPLGYDWKIGIGLIGAFAAREVFVSTMGVVYSIGEDADEASEGLHQAMEKDQRSNGDALWNLPTVFSVLVFFVIAMQCISTVAVMRQETGGWKWPLIQLFSMNGLAYVMAFLVFQIGSAL